MFIKQWTELNRIIGFFVILSVMSVGSPLGAENFFDGHVEAVIDGDTIMLRGGTVVQYMGIESVDAVSSANSLSDIAALAKQYNKQLVEKKTVRLEIVEQATGNSLESKKYAYVFSGGQMVNAALLKKGYALISQTIPPEEKYADFFVRAQQSAVLNNAGLWAKLAALEKKKANTYAFQ